MVKNSLKSIELRGSLCGALGRVIMLLLSVKIVILAGAVYLPR
jgi:hypothetical protein